MEPPKTTAFTNAKIHIDTIDTPQEQQSIGVTKNTNKWKEYLSCGLSHKKWAIHIFFLSLSLTHETLVQVCNSQRTQTAGCCLDTGTQSWWSPVSSDGQRRWGTPCTHPGWTPGSFLEAPRKSCTTKRVKIHTCYPALRYTCTPTHRPVAGEPAIAARAVFQRRC